MTKHRPQFCNLHHLLAINPNMNICFPTLLKYQKQQNRDTDSDVHLNINFGNKEKFDICLPTNVLCYFCWVQNNSVCDACIYCGQIRNK